MIYSTPESWDSEKLTRSDPFGGAYNLYPRALSWACHMLSLAQLFVFNILDNFHPLTTFTPYTWPFMQVLPAETSYNGLTYPTFSPLGQGSTRYGELWRKPCRGLKFLGREKGSAFRTQRNQSSYPNLRDMPGGNGNPQLYAKMLVNVSCTKLYN